MLVLEIVENGKKRTEKLNEYNDYSSIKDGVVDSIRLCLRNMTTKRYRDMLFFLTKSF
jgi:hypothetical protein